MSDASDSSSRRVIEVDPLSGDHPSHRFDFHPTWLTWSEGYGDLWIGDIGGGSVSRMHAETGP